MNTFLNEKNSLCVPSVITWFPAKNERLLVNSRIFWSNSFADENLSGPAIRVPAVSKTLTSGVNVLIPALLSRIEVNPRINSLDKFIIKNYNINYNTKFYNTKLK